MFVADDLKTLHQKYVLTPWLAQGALDAPVIVRGEGVFLYDSDDKRYIDFSSGLIAVNLGHGNPTVLAAMHAQIDRLCYSPPNWFNDQRALLGETLASISPWAAEGARVFFTTSGAQANEDAVRFARALTGRHKILSAYRSFHGASSGASALTGENRRWSGEPQSAGHVVRFWGPYPYRSPFYTTDPATETLRALQHVRATIAAEDPARVAAILVEPVIGSNGVIVPPPGYLAGLREICDEFGILLIFDEVMTGFGRTGAPFASQRFEVTPDIIVFAKGVTSAYAPLGGVLVREVLASRYDTVPLGSGHTYSGHPVSMAAALGAIAAYREGGYFQRGNLIERWLREKLGKLQAKYDVIGDVRGLGAFFCLEFVRDRATREPLIAWQGSDPGPMPVLYRTLRENGIYTFGRYNLMMVAPPLTIEEAELDEAMEGIEIALAALTNARG